MQASALPNLRRALGYAKFKRERVRAVVIDSGYHLQGECIASLRALGHTVRSVTMQAGQPFAELLQHLLHTLTSFRPDFVLSINHLGFDRDGVMAQLLERAQMPLAVWYVDSPFFVLRQAQLAGTDVTSLFIWDKSYSAALRKAGAQEVHYLPLAADSRMLDATNTPPPETKPILFVGDSMQHADQKWRSRVDPGQHDACTLLTAHLSQDRSALVDDDVLARHIEHGSIDLLALATFRATAQYRTKTLSALCASNLHIVGDSGWSALLPHARLHPPVPYGLPLMQAFQSACININATSLQMPTAVNQRVFDVPSSHAFLLTDAQHDVVEHFALPKDWHLFTEPEHARELCDFYLRRPTIRKAITASLNAQVRQRHTYAHRLDVMLGHLRRRHGRISPAALEPATCTPLSP